MHFSPVLRSSPHCLPSPDGTLIAALLPASISITEVASLDVIRSIRLPSELASSVTTFVWSPSSGRLLLATADQVHVFSVAPDSNYHATIRNPSSAVGKSTFVDFGATDDEACVFSAFGIKLSVFSLPSSNVVEIGNPKFYKSSSAARGFSFRPQTHHLALLTRTAGKDMISIHAPGTRELQRSWAPDMIDAQGLSWTLDGKWLIAWETPAQGYRVLLYTADGHLFKQWSGPSPDVSGGVDYRLGAGVKLLALAHNGQCLAIADSGRCLYMLYTSSLTEYLRLCHPAVIEPRDITQVWQEQASRPGFEDQPAFLRASQPVSPPTRAQDTKTGCEHAAFDCSSTLLATKLEDAPSTVWIWDVAAAELRAVLIFHANISRIDWHPAQPELLSIRCEGESYNGVVFVWDPLMDGPLVVNFRPQFPEGKISGKAYSSWVKADVAAPTLILAGGTSCLLCSLPKSADEKPPWQEDSPAKELAVDQSERMKPLLDVSEPAVGNADQDTDTDDEDASDLEDTFHFKNAV